MLNRSKILKYASGVATAALLSCTTASATSINFDNLANGVLVTNQYAGVTFSAGGGDGVYTSAQIPPYLTSAPNFICTGTGGIDCTHDIFLAFSSPVSGLTFNMTGDDAAAGAVVSRANVYNGAALLGGVNITADGNHLDAQLIDLSAFFGVTKLEIVNDTDPGGLAFDDFTFNAGAINAVPEPFTLSLFGAGFVGMVSMCRRKKKTA